MQTTKKIPRLIRFASVNRVGGFGGKSSLYDAINAGLWTKGVKIGPRAVAWPEDEVNVLVAARIAELSHDEIRELVKELHAARKRMDPRSWCDESDLEAVIDPREIA